MPRNRFLLLAVGLHIVLGTVAQEPPPHFAQRLFQLPPLHCVFVHLSVYIGKQEQTLLFLLALALFYPGE